MVIARRAAYLDYLGLPPQIQGALMALPIESPKLFAGRVPEAQLYDAEEDEVDHRKDFLKPSSSGYHKQQTFSMGKGPVAGKSSTSASQAKQSKPKHPPQPSKDSGSSRWSLLLLPRQSTSPSEEGLQASCRTGIMQQMTLTSFGQSARASG